MGVFLFKFLEVLFYTNESKIKTMGNLKYARKCDDCKKGMNSGFVINSGEEYYCSDTCLHKHYTKKEYKEMYGDGETETYYTVWEDDRDLQYVEINGVVVEIDEDEID